MSDKNNEDRNTQKLIFGGNAENNKVTGGWDVTVAANNSVAADNDTSKMFQLFPSISCTVFVCIAIIAMLFVNNYPSEDILEPILGSLFMPSLLCAFTLAFVLSIFVTMYKKILENMIPIDQIIEMKIPVVSEFVKTGLKPLISFLQKFSISTSLAALIATLLLFSNVIAMFRASTKNSLILSSMPLVCCLCTSSCIASVRPSPPPTPTPAPKLQPRAVKSFPPFNRKQSPFAIKASSKLPSQFKAPRKGRQ